MGNAYIGMEPQNPFYQEVRSKYTASNGQTLFTGLAYKPGYIDVYVNGSKLVDGIDFTALTGNSVTMSVALTAGDVVEIQTQVPTQIVDTLNHVTGVPRAELASNAGAGLIGYTPAGSGVVVRDVESKLREVVSVKDFGAVGDGSDETTKLQNALNYAFSNNKELVIDIPVYTAEITISSGTGYVRCVGAGKILPFNTVDQTDIYDSQLITFDTGVVDSEFNLVFDMRGFSKSACVIKGHRNRIPYCKIENIQASAGRTKQLWGVSISGDDVQIGRIDGINLNSVATMSAGGATLSIVQHAKNTNVDYIYSVSGFCAYLGNGINTTINTIYSEGCTDNVVYSIAGSENFICNKVVARNCSDEVVVFSGDSSGATIPNVNGYVGHILAYDCSRGVGFYKSTNPRIGVIEWYVGSMSANSGSPLYIRPTQTTQLDSITVDELRVFGTWNAGAPIWTLDHGGCRRLSIGKLICNLIYTDTSKTVTKTLGFSSAPIDQIRIGEIDVIVSDGTGGLLIPSDVFRLNLPSSISKPSSIDSVRLSNDGGNHLVRLTYPIQDSLIIDGDSSIHGDQNPPFIENNDAGQVTRVFGSGESPSYGTWKRGDIIWNQFPTNNGFVGWVCVSAGTPGAWVRFGPTGTDFSSGAYTPTVTPVTNLDAATLQSAQFSRVGQMVTMSGTLLLDPTATGSVVARITLPVASAFTSSFHAGGTACAGDGTINGVVTADTGTGTLQITANATTTAARNVTFHATYRIL